MKTNFKVGVSPITGTIYAGKVNKNGTWANGKQDVTDTAPLAVAEHLIKLDEHIEFNYLGERWVLKAERL